MLLFCILPPVELYVVAVLALTSSHLLSLCIPKPCPNRVQTMSPLRMPSLVSLIRHLDPFDNWKHLAKHRWQHHREGLWLCDGENCSRNFTSYLDLQSHMNLIHAERKWVCLREDCYFYQQNRRLTELAYKRHLTEHAIMDNPEATQPCLMCGMHVIVSKVAAHIAHYHTESVQCRNA